MPQVKQKATIPWTVEKTGRNVFTVRLPYAAKKGWEQRFLLSSDRHWDNPKSDHKMQKDHLDEAVQYGAGVIDCGDLFCAMQGKYDKRANKSDLRPEHQVENYLDALVNTAADFFTPYAKNWIVIAQGNHESSLVRRHETNIGERLD